MNYAKEFQKYTSSQYIYSAIRITLAIVIPSIILAHFGLLKEYFLFPLGTSFVGLTDMPGPYNRRRNSLLLAVLCFTFVEVTAGIFQTVTVLQYTEIIIFGLFFTLLGVYGSRLAAVGSLSLVVLGIFIDGHLSGENILKNTLVFSSGCLWFVVVFMLLTRIQPYKLPGQMIGENYLELAKFLKLKSEYYNQNPNFEILHQKTIASYSSIKNLQEETRETVFKTRKIVNESTTMSRWLMLTFLKSIDLHEKLLTSESDYIKLHKTFKDEFILTDLHHYLLLLADEMENIGIALQRGIRARPVHQLNLEMDKLYTRYTSIRNRKMSPETLEDFMIIRLIILRIIEIKEEINDIYLVYSQDLKVEKKHTSNLDYNRFVPKEEKISLSVMKNNLSLKSHHFRHAIRMTTALLIGYSISKFDFLGIGHSYWILITIVAIMRPAYATTKHRNLLRLYGTIAGALIAYAILFFSNNDTLNFIILLISMILCFSFLKHNYFWAVLFMTIYIFITFDLLNPGMINTIFKDRILDTLIAGAVAFIISYGLLPVWEHTQNINFMKAAAKSNLAYFSIVILKLKNEQNDIQAYKMARKDAIISLANLSDNFQRMISDPKNQQQKMETVHQFVNTSHLITTYIASLSQYASSESRFPEIDAENWKRKISSELSQTIALLHNQNTEEILKKHSKIQPEDDVEILLEQRKQELQQIHFPSFNNPAEISHLTELKNVREILRLLYDVAKEQRKISEQIQQILKAQQP